MSTPENRQSRDRPELTGEAGAVGLYAAADGADDAPIDRRNVRAYGLFVLVVTVPLLSVALWLVPDARGYDTHTGLGLAACGFPQRWGLPCPACGMTTAFANAVRGRFVAAFRAQVFGTLLCVACLVWTAAAAGQLLTGRNLLAPVAPKMSWLLPAAALLMAAWAIKAWQMTSG